jgi:beta-N-acetylhexosaminidase
MARNSRAAGIIMGGIGGLSPQESDSGAADILASYAGVGIRAYLFPGFLVRQPERLMSLVAMARRAASEAGLGRPLVSIGGEAKPEFGFPPFAQSPSPLGLASSRSAAAARRAGAFLGFLLSACGVDLVLAPRLDLASDPKDPAGALGGFGEDSNLAGLLGAAYARGLARAGVASCIGRFPGLGATSRDSNVSMDFVALPVERLERCEMRPFARVVASGVAAVLVGKVLVPALESERIPASSSARVIEGRLRESLGFRGVVIGDDIGPEEDPGRAAILGALAGCDLCLYSQQKDALAAAAVLEKAASTGELPAIRIEMSRRRVDALLLDFPRGAPRVPSFASGQLERARRDIQGCASLLRGSLQLDGSLTGDFSKTFVLVFMPPKDAPDLPESDAVMSTLRSELPGSFVLSLPADPGSSDPDVLTGLIAPRGRFTEAAILTYDAHFRPAQEGLARLVEEFIPRFRVVAMRDPYDAAFFPNALGLGAAYGFSEGCAQAVGRILAGKLKARGGRPVEVIGLEI